MKIYGVEQTKLFITGSSGFIGKNLVEFFSSSNIPIFEYKRGDNIETNLRYFKPTAIINCAAEIYNAEKMIDSNIILTSQILDYIKDYSPDTKLVQIGSSAEYGPVDHPTSETDRINPVDMYQATKGSATLLCQGYAKQFDLNVSIARPYSVYGKYEKPHRLFPRLWKAFKLNEPMTLYQGYHDFIYIDDFVRGINIILNTKTNGDIINFGSGVQYSNTEVLETFESITKNSNAPVKFMDTMAKKFESEIWKCNPMYADITYRFKTLHSLEDGIERFLKTANYTRESI